MSQVEETISPAQAPAACSAAALWLVLGKRRIEWGAVSAAGDAGWVSLGSVEVLAHEPQATPNRVDLLAALRSLPEQPFGACSLGARLNVCLADHWVPVIVLPWNAEQRYGELPLPWVSTQFATEGFRLEPDDWIREDDGPYGSSRFLVAYPGEVMKWLEVASKSWGRALDSVRTTALACWSLVNQTSETRALVVLEEEDLVLLGSPGATGTAANLSAYHRTPWVRHTAGVAGGEVESHALFWLSAWQRLCLRQPIWAAVDVVTLMDSRPVEDDRPLKALPTPFVAFESGKSEKTSDQQSPQAALLVALTSMHFRHALDAVSPRQTWRLYKVLLALALCSGVGFLGLQAVELSQQRQDLEQLVEQRLRSAAPLAPTIRWTREEAARVQVVNRAVRQMNLPVHALLRSLEPPKDIQVAILSVDSTGQSSGDRADAGSNLRIIAQASSSADMARYVAFVSSRKPFSGAYLSRHEWVDGTKGQARMVRFSVEAVWID